MMSMMITKIITSHSLVGMMMMMTILKTITMMLKNQVTMMTTRNEMRFGLFEKE